MEDIERDYDKPILDACIAAKTSLIVRVGMLELGAGTGSFRVRQMMHRIAYPMGVHVRADVNLTDIEASCTDGVSRITEVVDLPTTGVNTERIWLLEHFADWLSVNCGQSSTYHAMPSVSEELVDNLDDPHVYAVARKALKETTAEAVENLDQIEQSRLEAAQMDTMTAVGLGAVGNQAASSLDGGDGAAEITAEHIEREESSGVEPVAADRGITVRQAHERLNLIERRKPLYSPIFSGFAAAVACAAFVFLLGGGPYDMAGAFVGAGIGQWFRRQMLDRRINQFFATGASVIIAALACIGTLRLVGFFDPVALRHDTAYIGAILYVIPGFPLVTGGLDIAKLDFPSGIQRITYAFSIILVATLGGWAVARMVMLNPQGFEPMVLNAWVLAGLRMVAAFCGVWGFSVLFNSPQRMALVAATIGALTDTMRLEMQDLLNVPPEMGAFLGAFVAGILATVWRSSVRHGYLPPDLGYPRISLTVPSIVIMVPGLYMYRAMFYLGQFNTLEALDWAFRAFMVIICLPIGLVVARVITDKSWRYDV
ncbi:threonine/serine ThrE exporter family protein [Bifidobacterium coryneforme]|uniref:threonine/serine ThrE exporter family protein n=1 Tax=Bifidobacterium coryneforme TaxID=1687 RepID=UPI003C6C4DB0